MKKPTKPRKPIKPRKPEKEVSGYRRTGIPYIGNDESLVTIEHFSLAAKELKCDPSAVSFHVNVEWEDDYPDNYWSTDEACVNENYDKQMEAFKKKEKAYKEKMKDYKIKLAEWKVLEKEWEEVQRLEKIVKLKAELNKLEA